MEDGELPPFINPDRYFYVSLRQKVQCQLNQDRRAILRGLFISATLKGLQNVDLRTGEIKLACVQCPLWSGSVCGQLPSKGGEVP